MTVKSTNLVVYRLAIEVDRGVVIQREDGMLWSSLNACSRQLFIGNLSVKIVRRSSIATNTFKTKKLGVLLNIPY